MENLQSDEMFRKIISKYFLSNSLKIKKITTKTTKIVPKKIIQDSDIIPTIPQDLFEAISFK